MSLGSKRSESSSVQLYESYLRALSIFHDNTFPKIQWHLAAQRGVVWDISQGLGQLLREQRNMYLAPVGMTGSEGAVCKLLAWQMRTGDRIYTLIQFSVVPFHQFNNWDTLIPVFIIIIIASNK